MNNYGSDIVRMSFEGSDFLRGVVIVYTDLEIIRTANDPVFAGDESASSHRDIREFKSLDNGLNPLSMQTLMNSSYYIPESRKTIYIHDLEKSRLSFSSNCF